MYQCPVLLCWVGLSGGVERGRGCCLGFRGFVRGLICVGFGRCYFDQRKSFSEEGWFYVMERLPR